MSRKRTGQKIWNGIKVVVLTILGVATLAFAGLGIWKTVDLVKDYQNKQVAEQEQEVGPDMHILSAEEQIVKSMKF